MCMVEAVKAVEIFFATNANASRDLQYRQLVQQGSSSSSSITPAPFRAARQAQTEAHMALIFPVFLQLAIRDSLHQQRHLSSASPWSPPAHEALTLLIHSSKLIPDPIRQHKLSALLLPLLVRLLADSQQRAQQVAANVTVSVSASSAPSVSTVYLGHIVRLAQVLPSAFKTLVNALSPDMKQLFQSSYSHALQTQQQEKQQQRETVEKEKIASQEKKDRARRDKKKKKKVKKKKKKKQQMEK